MTNMSEIAIGECVAELRAACRRPIDEAALDTMLGWVRPDFDRILNRLDGKKRWAEHGERVRETGRHLGALADFFAAHNGTNQIGIDELTQAMKMSRADCTVRAERTAVAWQFCTCVPLDVHVAEEFLRAMAPAPALLRRAG
jgi:hypothetical protein